MKNGQDLGAVPSAGEPKPTQSPNGHIRLVIIGAGARGNAYARAVTESTPAIIAAVADPIPFKRNALGKKYIWSGGNRQEDQEFDDYQSFMRYEVTRRKREVSGERVLPSFDGVFICTLDEMHAEIITAIAPLGLHIMSEKPLATTLNDCLRIYKALQPSNWTVPKVVFSIGHVLRYSPHNILLRKLLLADDVIGDTISIEHTEPVGWWHFSHSYVRGNWRKESVTAPSLLTKSCHDIDFLLWLLCSPSIPGDVPPHLPNDVASTGSLAFFRKNRKPPSAGNATNCLSCHAEKDCIYSADKIYNERHLSKGNVAWPIHIVDPEIEDCLLTSGRGAAEAKLKERLSEDYTGAMPESQIDSRPWFGRCVYESNNDVCDDQMVTMTWREDPLSINRSASGSIKPQYIKNRGAKTASFHMIAFTEKQCKRRGRIYGTKGELEYDSETIQVYDFATGQAKMYHPPQLGGGHGGGDDGLAQQYVKAIDAVKNGGMSVTEAQSLHVGCSLEEIVRSHAMVFAAEEARREKKVVNWGNWWVMNVMENK